MVLDDIEQGALRVVEVGGPHDEVAREHVLEESDPARIELDITAHLG